MGQKEVLIVLKSVSDWVDMNYLDEVLNENRGTINYSINKLIKYGFIIKKGSNNKIKYKFVQNTPCFSLK